MTKLPVLTLVVLAFAALALAACQSDAARGIYVAPPAGGWENYRG
jgi:hypothetical protein